MYIAILGYGTVGSGIARVLEMNSECISQRAGEKIEVKYILDLREFPGDPLEKKVVHDINIILDDPQIQVVCETMGGNEPAYTYSKEALKRGKSVCTSNKELVANHGAELIALGKEHYCHYLFEASVGGGIPIIRPLNDALTAEKIVEITGILNGTTNYILTHMQTDGAAFEDVLKSAQEKGYAERNPEADVEGYDACRKIAILSSMAAGKTVDFRQIYTEGITKIGQIDFEYARKLGKTIKLLATSREEKDGYFAMVAPFLVGEENPLASVNGVFNAILVEGNTLGECMFYGKGAGKLPTASAVVSDVVECARNPRGSGKVFWKEGSVKVSSIDEASGRSLIRVKSEDEKQAKELFEIKEILRLDTHPEEFGFVTEKMKERDVKEKLDKLSGVLGRIRIKS